MQSGNGFGPKNIAGDAIGIGIKGNENIVGKDISIVKNEINWNLMLSPLKDIELLDKLKSKLLNNPASVVLEEILSVKELQVAVLHIQSVIQKIPLLVIYYLENLI